MRTAHARTLLLVLLSVVLAACAARTGDGMTRADRNVVTAAEIDASSHTDAYALLRALHPQWLRARGTSSLNLQESVKVYLDGSLLGGVDHLRQITTHSLAEIRFMDGPEATQRWGLDHGAGAIVLTTRR